MGSIERDNAVLIAGLCIVALIIVLVIFIVNIILQYMQDNRLIRKYGKKKPSLGILSFVIVVIAGIELAVMLIYYLVYM